MVTEKIKVEIVKRNKWKNQGKIKEKSKKNQRKIKEKSKKNQRKRKIKKHNEMVIINIFIDL